MAAEKSVSLTTDVLDRVDIGLWAVEIDEGRAPRMYANKTMLKLLGLGEGVAAEDVFHAWFDNIDPEHFEEVKAYVDKMSAGGKAEIQYPWHSPDGRVRFVRCGGTRDYEYKDGVRLKGWHRDITELVLIQKTAEEELRKEIKTMGLDAKRESLQSALNEKLYGKAILDKAYSYFKVNLSEGKVYSPFIQIIEGKSIDVSDSFGPAFPSYDAVLECIAENALDQEYRDSFVQHLSAKSLIDLMGLFDHYKTMTKAENSDKPIQYSETKFERQDGDAFAWMETSNGSYSVAYAVLKTKTKNYYTIEVDQKNRITDIEKTLLDIVKSRKTY